MTAKPHRMIIRARAILSIALVGLAAGGVSATYPFVLAQTIPTLPPDLLGPLALTVALLFTIWAGVKENPAWVPGWIYRKEKEAHQKEIDDINARHAKQNEEKDERHATELKYTREDRDEWKTRYLDVEQIAGAAVETTENVAKTSRPTRRPPSKATNN